MIETFAPYRTDHPFGERILPWRARRNHDLLDAHTLDALAKRESVYSIAITAQKSWRLVKQKSLDDLLRCPFSRWMSGDVEVHDLTAVVAKHNEREQDPERGGRNREEVDGDDVLDVVVEERTPSL